ncbi:hypothetical protein PspLS_01800 [Pyricularia sp. CBS 133598]|nr:hypothetical protein PspLS_01800 [Pyricularia sp. CBS 133598]
MLGINTVSLEDAITREHGKINDVDVFGRSPIHLAVGLADVAVARTLLRHGSEPSIRDKYGNSLLHYACQYNQLQMASLLIDAGVDVNITNIDGHAALCYAIDEGNPNLVRLLLRKGAFPNTTDKYGAKDAAEKILALIVDAGGDVHLADNHGRTPLLRASLFGLLYVMRALVRHGARSDHLDNNGRGLVYYALSEWCQKSLEKLRWESDLVGLDPDFKDIYGETPIQRLYSRLTPDADELCLERPPVTHLLAFTASALVVELREQNWAAGRFLQSRRELQESGWHNALKRWLGAEFLAMQYDQGLQHDIWDPNFDWYFLEEDVDERQDPWEREPWVEDDDDGGCVLGLLALFGEDRYAMEDLEVATNYPSDCEDEEEFFDAVDLRECSEAYR